MAPLTYPPLANFLLFPLPMFILPILFFTLSLMLETILPIPVTLESPIATSTLPFTDNPVTASFVFDLAFDLGSLVSVLLVFMVISADPVAF